MGTISGGRVIEGSGVRPLVTYGAPASGAFAGVAPRGALVNDALNGVLYINSGTTAAPVWDKVGTQGGPSLPAEDTVASYSAASLDGPAVFTGHYGSAIGGPIFGTGELRNVQPAFKIDVAFFGAQLRLKLAANSGATLAVSIDGGAYALLTVDPIPSATVAWFTVATGLQRDAWHEITIQHVSSPGNVFLDTSELLEVTGPDPSTGRLRLPHLWDQIHRILNGGVVSSYLKAEGSRIATGPYGVDEADDLAHNDASWEFDADIDELWFDAQSTPTHWDVYRNGVRLTPFTNTATSYYDWRRVYSGLHDGTVYRYRIVKNGAAGAPYSNGRVSAFACRGGTGIRTTARATRSQVLWIGDSLFDRQRRNAGDGHDGVVRRAMDLAGWGGCNAAIAGANVGNFKDMVDACTVGGAGTTQAFGYAPSKIIINLGINDASIIYHGGTVVIGGATVTHTTTVFRDEMKAQVNRLLSLFGAADIYLVRPSRYGDTYVDGPAMNAFMDSDLIPALEAVPALTDAPTRVHVVDGWTLYNVNDATQTEGDALHPNGVGHGNAAPTFAAILTS